MRLAALIVLSVVPGTLAAAEPNAKARQLNTEGMRLYGKKDYRAALKTFDQALAADPSFVLAHYNAASMASLTGDVPRVIAELQWLIDSKDAVAAKALVQAKTDRDLDRASMHPRVRSLIGLPSFDKIDLAELLTERGGIWGADSSFCAAHAFTLRFKKGGSVAIQTEWACNDGESNEAETGSWKVAGGKVVITAKKAFPGGKTGAIASCDSAADGGACLVIDGDEAGSFHRGPGALQ